MNTLEQATKDYVTGMLPAHHESVLYFHDLRHTKHVVKAVRAIGEASGLSGKQIETGTVAAWFQNVGYLNDHANPVDHSVAQARQFLEAQNVPTKRIDRIEAAIRAVHAGQPETQLEQVLYDADRAYLGGETFLTDTENQRKEYNHFATEPVAHHAWWQQTLDQLRLHEFKTDYARRHYAHLQDRNAEKLEKKLARHQRETELHQQIDLMQRDLDHERAKSSKPLRGAETLFRTTSHNHLELSKIADSKASLMIQVNSIIISLIVSVLLRWLENAPYLMLPALLLVSVSLVTIVLSILATRPHVTKGTFTTEQVRKDEANLLFFVNFYQMSLPDYEQGMEMILTDNHLLYGSMVRDLYYLGRVLGRKYRYIRLAYTVFMFGLILSVLGFGLALLFAPATTNLLTALLRA